LGLLNALSVGTVPPSVCPFVNT